MLALLEKSGLDHGRGSQTLKESSSVIGPRMPKPPRHQNEVEALEKMIGRYYRSLRKS